MRLKLIILFVMTIGLQSQLFAGEHTYPGGVTELRVNKNKTIYVYVNIVLEQNCTKNDHYVVRADNDARDLIYEALTASYLSGLPVSFKTVLNGCYNDQPVIKFMRLREQ